MNNVYDIHTGEARADDVTDREKTELRELMQAALADQGKPRDAADTLTGPLGIMAFLCGLNA